MPHVMVFGTFDGLHPGHRHLFAQAKALGDHVTAVVARDETVVHTKGRLPSLHQDSRVAAVQVLPEIDTAILGNPGDKWQVIRDHAPNVILLGYDQEHFTEALEAFCALHGIDVVRAHPFHPGVHSSTAIKERGGLPPEPPA